MRAAMFAVAVFFLAFNLSAEKAAQPPVPSVDLPPELERVLRDYEKAWQRRDAKALAALFTADGFVLSNGEPPARGRAAIETTYSHGGGPLSLRALAYSVDGSVGYIIGAYAPAMNDPDMGKFVLALKKGEDGRWLIAADIDNTNARARPMTPAQ